MNRRRSPVADEEWQSGSDGLARWILPALIASLLLHGLLWLWANNYRIDRLSDGYYDRIVPRTFHLERAEIDPKLLDPAPDLETRAASAPVAVKLPEEKVSFEKMMGDRREAPAAPKLDAAALADTPSAEATSFATTIQAAQAAGVRSLMPDDKALTEELLKDKPMITGSALIEMPDPENLGGATITRQGASSGDVPPGFSDLDQLLAQTGPLSPETAPILMPTDLLFDYNQADLRQEAVTSLSKLGQLIRKNPKARFVIEGHTDSFGTKEYNDDLSLRRANSVKDFLTTTLGLPPESIETRGFGSSRLIAPADGTIEQQQINRRVEIVIRAPADQ
jgi:outer membrane protein OmpA-like peptidoglycan-associated protein